MRPNPYSPPVTPVEASPSDEALIRREHQRAELRVRQLGLLNLSVALPILGNCVRLAIAFSAGEYASYGSPPENLTRLTPGICFGGLLAISGYFLIRLHPAGRVTEIVTVTLFAAFLIHLNILAGGAFLPWISGPIGLSVAVLSIVFLPTKARTVFTKNYRAVVVVGTGGMSQFKWHLIRFALLGVALSGSCVAFYEIFQVRDAEPSAAPAAPNPSHSLHRK